MGRYIGPKAKIARREGTNLFGLPKITRILTRKNYGPGIHGPTTSKFRKKTTSYGEQLREKQKAKRMYGILEKQFSNYFAASVKEKGNTEFNLKTKLEMRFDNIVYRLGFNKSRAQARQLIVHGHFLVNKKKVDIPSYNIKVGDVIEIRSKSTSSPIFADAKEGERIVELPNHLTFDHKNLIGKVVSLPTEEILDPLFDAKLIIEFYSH